MGHGNGVNDKNESPS